MRRRAFFLERGDGSLRAALHWQPERPALAGLLLLQGLAEEQNKTRRALAQACAALCDAGYAVLTLDLHGCGDSDGDFADARWAGWLADAEAACAWLAAAHTGTPLLGWGVRGGALLASALAEAGRLQGQLWWQPTAQGKSVVQQWLRTAAATALVADSARLSPADLRRQLQDGQPLDLAGYAVHPDLAGPIDNARLAMPTVPTLWLESSSQESPALLPGSRQLLATWPQAPVTALAVRDASPWAATELEDVPRMVEASVAWLQQANLSRPA